MFAKAVPFPLILWIDLITVGAVARWVPLATIFVVFSAGLAEMATNPINEVFSLQQKYKNFQLFYLFFISNGYQSAWIYNNKLCFGLNVLFRLDKI